MFGVRDDVVAQWGEQALLKLLANRPSGVGGIGVGAIGLYQRDAKDPTTTMRLPLRRHLHYAAQGFLLVKIEDSDGT